MTYVPINVVELLDRQVALRHPDSGDVFPAGRGRGYGYHLNMRGTAETKVSVTEGLHEDTIWVSCNKLCGCQLAIWISKSAARVEPTGDLR